MSKQLLQPGEYGHVAPYFEEKSEPMDFVHCPGESQLIYTIGCDACSTVINQPGSKDITGLQDRFRERACSAVRDDFLYMSIY